MRIGIEACTWANRRGYGRFTRGLVTALVERFADHEFELVLDAATAAAGTFPERARLVVVETAQQQVRAAAAEGSRRIADMWRLGRTVARRRHDVYLFPTRYSYYPVPSLTPTVVAFHDATAELHPRLIFPHWRSRMLWAAKTRLALLQAREIVTVSESARRQVAAAFGRAPERIAVVTEGPDPVFRPLADPELGARVRERHALPEDAPLVLYVGGISPHKNLDGLLRELAGVPGDWHAVLVGDIEGDSFWGCHRELESLASELGLSGRVTFTGFVPDDELAALYGASRLLVLPSFGEGFGLPVVEAMACGLPVVVSDRASLPEVTGDAGLTFDPDRASALGGAIGRLLTDDDLHRELSRRGLERSRLYSWERGAELMFEVLERAARVRRRRRS